MTAKFFKFELILNKNLFTGNKFYVVQFLRPASLAVTIIVLRCTKQLHTCLVHTIKETTWGSKKKVLSGEVGQELSKITLASIHFGAVYKCRRFKNAMQNG